MSLFILFYFILFLAILLGHLKMPFEDIKNSLLAMDEKKFSEAHLKQLLLYAPDSKEVTANTSPQTGRPMKCTLNSTVGRNVLFLEDGCWLVMAWKITYDSLNWSS